jgi:hypothetical protein
MWANGNCVAHNYPADIKLEFVSSEALYRDS